LEDSVDCFVSIFSRNLISFLPLDEVDFAEGELETLPLVWRLSVPDSCFRLSQLDSAKASNPK